MFVTFVRAFAATPRNLPRFLILAGIVTAIAAVVFLSGYDEQRIDILGESIPFVVAGADSGLLSMSAPALDESMVSIIPLNVRMSYKPVGAYIVSGARIVGGMLEIADDDRSPEAIALEDFHQPYFIARDAFRDEIIADSLALHATLADIEQVFRSRGADFARLSPIPEGFADIADGTLNVAGAAALVRTNAIFDSLSMDARVLRFSSPIQTASPGQRCTEWSSNPDWWIQWSGAIIAVEMDGVEVTADLTRRIDEVESALSEPVVTIGLFDQFSVHGCGKLGAAFFSKGGWTGRARELTRISVLPERGDSLRVALGRETALLSEDDFSARFIRTASRPLQAHEDRSVTVSTDGFRASGFVRDARRSGERLVHRRWRQWELASIVGLLVLAFAPFGLGIKMLWEDIKSRSRPDEV